MEPLLDGNLDDLLRTALTLADRGQVPKDESREWYGEVVLGEMTTSEFFSRVRRDLVDEALASLLDQVRAKVPVQGKPVSVPGTSTAPPEPSGARLPAQRSS